MQRRQGKDPFWTLEHDESRLNLLWRYCEPPGRANAPDAKLREAIQTIAGELDCFVADAPRNDELERLANNPSTSLRAQRSNPALCAVKRKTGLLRRSAPRNDDSNGAKPPKMATPIFAAFRRTSDGSSWLNLSRKARRLLNGRASRSRTSIRGSLAILGQVVLHARDRGSVGSFGAIKKVLPRHIESRRRGHRIGTRMERT